MKLSVIGTGYLGATHAAAMASLGFEVTGVDVDEAKIELLRSGKVPFFEPGLEELPSILVISKISCTLVSDSIAWNDVKSDSDKTSAKCVNNDLPP